MTMYIYIENIRREFTYFNNPKYSILLLHLFIVIIILPFLWIENNTRREENAFAKISGLTNSIRFRAW